MADFVDKERALFEEWYRTYRNHDQGNGITDTGDPFITLFIRADTGHGYLYGHPDSCWSAWIARATIALKEDQ